MKQALFDLIPIKTAALLVVLSGSSSSTAQVAPGIQWEQAYDWNSADSSTIDNAYYFQPTPDGGYVAVGNGYSAYWWSSRFRVLKIDAAGAVAWDRDYGDHTLSGHAVSVCPAQDGGYLVIGDVSGWSGLAAGNHGAWDIMALKLDAAGTIQWHKCLGGSGTESAGRVVQTTDGGYIICGGTSSNDGDVKNNTHLNPADPWDDLWLVRLDGSGNVLWERTFGSSSQDGGSAIVTMPDGGFVVCGYAGADDGDVSGHHGGNGYPDAWVLSVSAAGALQWQRCFGSTGTETVFDIKHTADDGFAAVGYTTQSGGDIQTFHGGYRDAWMIKLDRSGGLEWERSFGGTGEDMAGSVVETSPGHYVLAGQTNSSDGALRTLYGLNDIWAIKTDGAGNALWTKTLGRSSDDGALQTWTSLGIGVTVVQGQDHGLAIAASTASPAIPGFTDVEDFYIIKLLPEPGRDTIPGEGIVADTAQAVFIPNAFSPNNDGLNDRFRIRTGALTDHFYLQIFNRWGQRLFISYNAEASWDGRFQGAPAETGIYYYSLSYSFRGKMQTVHTGSIALIR